MVRKNKRQKRYVPSTHPSTLDTQEVDRPRQESHLVTNLIGGAILSIISLLGLHNLGVYEIDKGNFPKGAGVHPIAVGVNTIGNKGYEAISKGYSATSKFVRDGYNGIITEVTGHAGPRE